ncbi:MAG: acyl carrier protein [Candidatus Magnetomorum sp.]|nr:acyl carrier protein [Candidatus Magnetomorum sp.]
MTVENILKDILCDILDIDLSDIEPETYLIRDLDAESIDLLELAVNINQQFNTSVNEDDLFLRKLRFYLEEAEERGIEKNSYLKNKYPFLPNDRIMEILDDIEKGPVLKMKDLIHYVTRQN